jgi:hypothetical protein
MFEVKLRENKGNNKNIKFWAHISSPMLNWKEKESSKRVTSQKTEEPIFSSTSPVLFPEPSSSRCIIRVSQVILNQGKHANSDVGRNRGLLELDLKLDDLLEMQKDNQEDLDLEYVQFNVTKVLNLLNKRFARKKGW